MTQQGNINQLLADRSAAASYVIERDHAGKAYFYRQMIDLTGGLDRLGFLRQPSVLRIFANAKVRKGAGFTLAELKTLARGQGAPDNIETFLSDAVERSIFLRGYRLHCPRCQLEAWYALERVRESIPCDGCGMLIRLPLSLDFAYRLNHLYCMGMSQGCAAVLLTLAQFHGSKSSIFDYEMGLVLTAANGERLEVDLIVWTGDQLVVAECKDTFADKLATAPRSAGHTLIHTVEQARKSIRAARQLKADRFIFATLDERPIPPELATLREESGIAVEIWDRAKLMTG